MSRNPLQPLVTAGPGPRRFAGAAAAALLLALAAAPARAEFSFSRVQGHLGFGYGRVMIGHAPAGSIGLTAGFDHPVHPRLDLGVDLGFYLYGNRNVERGSLNATVDYGSFEAIAFTHWKVPFGPLSRVSFGPGLTSARAELSASAGGAAFLDLPVDEVAPTLALDLTVMPRRPAPVRVAAIAGWRSAFLEREDWHQFSVRLGFHY